MDSDSPEISYQQAPSPDLFSSEDEDNDNADDPPQMSSPLSSKNEEKVSTSQDQVQALESSRLHRLMELLQGVPPPPSVTIPQISLTEVLKKWKENVESSDGSLKNGESISSLWKPNASLHEVLHATWPDVKNIIYHDMHFNCCNASEDVELYSMKLHERFIGAETSTWCNAVTSSIPTSAKKRQRMRAFGNTSPGCRLSHLARRRQTFSSANLAQLSSVAGSGKAGGAPISGGNSSGSRRSLMNGVSGRRIMVEIKKTDKNKRIKTNSKEAIIRLPQAGNGPKNVPQAQPPVESTKRALFQSPEEQKCVVSLPCSSTSSESSSAQRSKRALWPSEKEALLNENGKRNLSNADSSNPQKSKMLCCDDRVPYSRSTRSLPFSLGHNSSSTLTSSSTSSQLNNGQNTGFNKSSRRASDQGPSTSNACSNLSELHKRKLFWAITTALRDVGITKSNADFTPMASTLAFHYVEVRQSMTGPAPTSTSEHMLKVVSSKVGEVVQAFQAEKAGQEENLVGGRSLKKEERSNKELFRDATASLNVRRSLCVSLSSSNHQVSDSKPKQTKRVPSARKSLSFDSIEPKTSSGTISDESIDKSDSKCQLDSKGNENKRKINGENVPLACAKRVSRSLFLSPKDEAKAGKKDASEQTCASDTCSNSAKTIDETADLVCNKNQISSIVCKGKANNIGNCDDERLQSTSEVSSIPSVSAVSSTLEADNEASETSEATTLSEHANSIDISSNLASLSACLQSKDDLLEAPTVPDMITNNIKTDSASSESCEFVPARNLRGTRERVARLAAAQPVRRNSRKSLSLCKRRLRSSSSDSVDQELVPDNKLSGKSSMHADIGGSAASSTVTGIPHKLELKVTLSPTKVASPMTSTECSTSKSAFGSPPFTRENVSTAPIRSPFLGFPSKEEPNLSGGALSLILDGPDSMLRLPAAGEGSSWLDTILTRKPDASSEDGNISQSDNGKVDLEEKVITPLLEAAVLESSVCAGSGSSHSTDVDLSFRGRIESLKPSVISDSALSLDLGLNLNVSANILDMDENKEKSPVLEKWAERASRSAQKNCASSNSTNEPVIHNDSAPVSGKSSETLADESQLLWEESQLLDASLCSTNMFEKFRSIFDSSSRQDNS